MDVTHVYSFLVHPGKGQDPQPAFAGTVVPKRGQLFAMLSEMFDRSDRECKIEISFEPTEGRQQNERRDDILSLIREPSVARARVLAARLQLVTTNRSGMGLFFIVIGKDDSDRKIHISRFPADMGILAEQTATTLKVEFLEKVFMRNAYAYKAVAYEGVPGNSEFWDGRAVDKQINHEITSISSYWIREFLLSDFRTTSGQGTRRLAVAMLRAIRDTDKQEVKNELIAAAMLGRGMNGESITINNFATRFGLSTEAMDAIHRQLEHPNLRFERFRFSADEFLKHLPFRSIELDNGATLTAATRSFDECFTKREVPGRTGTVEFTTRGKVVDEKFRKSK